MKDDKPHKTLDPPSPFQFYFSISKIAVSQICQSIGFKRAKSSALDSFTQIATLYLRALGAASAGSATFCGRTQCNLYDVVHALEDLSLPTGFPGAADVNQCLLRSKTLKELRDFVYFSKELPFVKRIPKCKFSNDSKKWGSGDVGIRGSEIPRWLPEFPDVEVKEEVVSWGSKECYWERSEIAEVKVRGVEEEKGRRRSVLPLMRERVKFELGKIKKKRERLEDVEMRNGVRGGGKMLCLGNGVSGDIEKDSVIV